MRYKKLLLVAFLLATFVFQQAQHVGAAMSSVVHDSSPSNNFQNYTQPEQMFVKMWRLNGNGTRVYPYHECIVGDPYVLDNSHGCVENPSNNPYLILYYPYNTNPALVDVENDYLLDVVVREMPVQLYPNLPALTAQSIAARSYANYQYETSDPTYKLIANDTRFQTFVPYAFDAYLGTDIFPANVNSCDNNLNLLQQKVCDAVTSTAGKYLSPHGSDQPAFTEFSADWGVLTAPGDYSYLQSVHDPISICGVDADGSHGRGLNQKGANRWALGNQCATTSDGDQPWPVRWTDYRQILAHYYTGIDFLNDSVSTGSTTVAAKIAPDDRWNLLDYRLEDDSDVPQQMTLGQEYRIKFHIQNTSTTKWNAGEITLGFTLQPACRPLQPSSTRTT